MKIGAQLYTLRDLVQTREGLVQALDAVAEMGYEGVQLSAVACMDGDHPEVTADEAARFLQERNLACAATHRPWESLRDNLQAEIEFHQTLSCSYVAVGVPPESARSNGLQGYRDWLQEARPIAEKLAQAGIQFGYHNHAFEFQKLENGIRPYDLLIDEAPWLFLELDTYWVHIAGMEVVPLVQKLPGRLPVVHVKDLTPQDWTVTYAPVGEGNLNWPTILPALKVSGTEWLLVEQDECNAPPLTCLLSSLTYLKTHR